MGSLDRKWVHPETSMSSWLLSVAAACDSCEPSAEDVLRVLWERLCDGERPVGNLGAEIRDCITALARHMQILERALFDSLNWHDFEALPEGFEYSEPVLGDRGGYLLPHELLRIWGTKPDPIEAMMGHYQVDSRTAAIMKLSNSIRDSYLIRPVYDSGLPIQFGDHIEGLIGEVGSFLIYGDGSGQIKAFGFNDHAIEVPSHRSQRFKPAFSLNDAFGDPVYMGDCVWYIEDGSNIRGKVEGFTHAPDCSDAVLLKVDEANVIKAMDDVSTHMFPISADGEVIEAYDTVYPTSMPLPLCVTDIVYDDFGIPTVHLDDQARLAPEVLLKAKPVQTRDGRALILGDTVYLDLDNPDVDRISELRVEIPLFVPLTVVRIDEDEVTVEFKDIPPDMTTAVVGPRDITHDEPDSLRRIAKDAEDRPQHYMEYVMDEPESIIMELDSYDRYASTERMCKHLLKQQAAVFKRNKRVDIIEGDVSYD